MVADPHPNVRTFVRLLGFLRPYRWSLAASIVLAVGSQLAAVAIAFLTGDALQRTVDSENTDQLWALALAVLLVGAARALFMVGRRLISGRQALAVEYDLRDEVYAKLLRLSFGFYDRHQTGQLMSRATVDLQSVRFFLGYGLIFFFQYVLTIVGVTIALFVIEWKLALAAAAFTPLLVYLAYRYSQVSIRCCATCSSGWPTSPRSPRRTSSASTSSSPSPRSRARRRSSARRPRRSSAARSTRTGSGRSTSRSCRSCR